jgi:hypothetical protein
MIKLRAVETPALPTIKCSQCSLYIDVRCLDEHKCVPVEPTLKGKKAEPSAKYFHTENKVGNTQ